MKPLFLLVPPRREIDSSRGIAPTHPAQLQMHAFDRRSERLGTNPVTFRAEGLLQGDLHRSRGLVRKQVFQFSTGNRHNRQVQLLWRGQRARAEGCCCVYIVHQNSQCQSDYIHWVTPARQCLQGEPVAFSQVVVKWLIRWPDVIHLIPLDWWHPPGWLLFFFHFLMFSDGETNYTFFILCLINGSFLLVLLFI